MAQEPAPHFPHPTKAAPFYLGEWLVLPGLNRVQRGEETAQIEPRTMHVLVCLASRPGALVTREELLATVWAGSVTCEDSLTRSISDLRRILRDDTRRPTTIETIRKSGYRLIARVKPVAEGAGGSGNGTALAEPSPTSPQVSAWSPAVLDVDGARARRRRTSARLRWAGGVAVLLLAAAVFALFWKGPRDGPSEPTPALLDAVPLTAYPGDERFPAVSPDGALVAFCWDRNEDGARDIYVKRRGVEPPLRLTSDPGDDEFPAWSPDGRLVAFLRRGVTGGIFIVPAEGGPERCVLQGAIDGLGLDWSPDGREIAFAQTALAGRGPAILVLSLESERVRRLTTPALLPGEDESPAFSPDGRMVAFVRVTEALREDLYLVPVEGGEERRLTFTDGVTSGFDWLSGGEDLVFSSLGDGGFQLWRLDVGTGRLQALATRAENASRPTSAARGACLVYENRPQHFEIWSLALLGGGAAVDPRARPLIRSTRQDMHATVSPDGQHVVFVSTRTGRRELWISDRAGQNARLLSSPGQVTGLRPCWSPDGRRLAAALNVENRLGVYLFAPAGGLPERLTGPTWEVVPRFWSRDGRWIYCDAKSDSGWRFARVAAASGGLEMLADAIAAAHCQSPDGSRLYYLHQNLLDICARPAAGGEAEVVFRWPHPQPLLQLEATPTHLLALAPEGRRGSSLYSIQLATGRLTLLHAFGPASVRDFSIVLADSLVLYDRATMSGDLALVEGFH